MKKIFFTTIALLAFGFTLGYCESGFLYHGSSTTLVGGLTNSLGSISAINSDVVISTDTGSRGYIYQDGTKIISAKEAIPTSSSTILTTFSTTNRTGGPCIAGSTITLTTSYNARVMLTFVATIQNTNATDNMFSPIVDGAFVQNLSSGHGIADIYTISNNNEMPYTFTYLTNPLSNGVHNFCMTAWAPAGTLSLSTGHFMQFAAVEVK